MLPSQRKILEVQAHELDLADDSGIRPKLAFEYAAWQVGGWAHLGHTSMLEWYTRSHAFFIIG